MSVEPRPRHPLAVRSEFDAFYDDDLPIVHGYLLRLCGGDHERAWNLTQVEDAQYESILGGVVERVGDGLGLPV